MFLFTTSSLFNSRFKNKNYFNVQKYVKVYQSKKYFCITLCKQDGILFFEKAYVALMDTIFVKL